MAGAGVTEVVVVVRSVEVVVGGSRTGLRGVGSESKHGMKIVNSRLRSRFFDNLSSSSFTCQIIQQCRHVHLFNCGKQDSKVWFKH